MKKIRQVLHKTVPTESYVYDPIFSDIFGPDADDGSGSESSYMQSNLDKTRYSRFELGPDPAMLGLANPHISDFDELLENEKHIINKIIFGQQALTSIVGTIGSGKSRLIRFVMSKLESATVPGTDKPPMQFYINLNDTAHADVFYSSLNEGEIRSAFYRHFNTQIRHQLSSIMDTDREIMAFWDRMLKLNSRELGHQLKNVVNLLRSDNIDIYADSDVSEPGKKPIPGYASAFERRKDLLKDIIAAPVTHALYLVEILGHLRKEVYQGYRWGIIIYIDNVDHLSFKAQHVIRQSVYPVLNGSGVRGIFPMRISTWRCARKADDFAFTVDCIPHCGPRPVDLLKGRLNAAKKLRPSHKGIKISDDDSWPIRVDELVRMIERPDDSIPRLISNLCGVCLRRAMVLGQFLVASLQYKFEDWLRQTGIKRMIICQGPTESFVGRPDRSVENVFAVYSHPCVAPLAKLRILTMLSGRGLEKTVGSVAQMLSSFGIDEPVARAALNELMQARKRMVWTDSLLHFNQDEFAAAASTLIAASTVAGGYLKLVGDIDYVEEVALDTFIDDDSATYFKPLQGAAGRIELTYQFCNWVFRRECEEVLRYFASGGTIEQYRHWFKSERLVSADGISSCLDSLHVITTRHSTLMGAITLRIEELKRVMSVATLAAIRNGDVSIGTGADSGAFIFART